MPDLFGGDASGRRAGDMRSGTVNREPEIVRAMRLAFVPGRRAGSSRYGFRCSLGYASFGGVAFLVCISCRNGRKRPFPGTVSRRICPALPGIRRGAAPCRLGRRNGCDRLLRACRWAFRGPAVRFRFLWPRSWYGTDRILCGIYFLYSFCRCIGLCNKWPLFVRNRFLCKNYLSMGESMTLIKSISGIRGTIGGAPAKI